MPVAGEPVGRPSAYGRDRLFVYLCVEGATDPAQEHAIKKLEAAGNPVVRLNMASKIDLGAEFFRWEMAVATAGHFLGVNVFDQPNVQESKDNTKRLLGVYEKKGKLPETGRNPPVGWHRPVRRRRAACAGGLRGHPRQRTRVSSARVGPGDYVALMAYMPSTGEHEELFQDARMASAIPSKWPPPSAMARAFSTPPASCTKEGPTRACSSR